MKKVLKNLFNVIHILGITVSFLSVIGGIWSPEESTSYMFAKLLFTGLLFASVSHAVVCYLSRQEIVNNFKRECDYLDEKIKSNQK